MYYNIYLLIINTATFSLSEDANVRRKSSRRFPDISRQLFWTAWARSRCGLGAEEDEMSLTNAAAAFIPAYYADFECAARKHPRCQI